MRTVFPHLGLNLTILAVLAMFFPVLGQEQSNEDSFIIQGRLTNSPERFLKIFFQGDADGENKIDTLHLDEHGNFYLKTWNVKHPQRTSIQQNRTQINDIYVAPGYDLTITGDASDFRTLVETLEITGRGSETNQYKIIRTKAYASLNDTTQYWTLGPDELAAYAERKKALDDSIVAVVFGKAPIEDKYFSFFAKMIRMDNHFTNMYYLLQLVNRIPMSHDESVEFMQNHFDREVLANFSRDEYLISKDYKTWTLDEYVKYRKNLDARKDSSLVKDKNYAVNKINEVLNGRVKDYYLNAVVTSSIPYTRSIEKLNATKERLKPYIHSIASESYKANIQALITDKELELIRTQKGEPAPDFTLKSDKGVVYRLSDFKGKVVYIDLWASWCIPCRKETPSFKQLYERYNDDQRIEFISIAVSDGEKEWRKALEEDQPQWLQLYDGEGKVNNAYVANAIPKFIVIDKQGNIVDFDAPRPSNGEELEALLLGEMVK